MALSRLRAKDRESDGLRSSLSSKTAENDRLSRSEKDLRGRLAKVEEEAKKLKSRYYTFTYFCSVYIKRFFFAFSAILTPLRRRRN